MSRLFRERYASLPNPLSETVHPLKDALRITLIYMSMGMLWIFFSDKLVAWLFRDIEAFQQAQMVKGWFYIFASGAIFFTILFSKLKLIESSAIHITSDLKRLHDLAYYDQLTHLPNRTMLMKQAGETLRKLSSEDRNMSLCFIDVDNFKHINETMTHSAGDALLCHIGSQLEKLQSDRIRTFRLGGDEFAILITDAPDLKLMLEEIQEWKLLIEKPWDYQDRQFHITVSMGIARFPEHGTDMDDLFKNADTALSHIKDHGKNGLAVFNDDMQAVSWTYLQLFNGLQNAIATGGFSLHYQPIVAVPSGETICLEALIRWPDPQRGLISPMEFIPFSENSGQIFAITEWVIRQTGRFLQIHRANMPQPVPVTINLSTVVLCHGSFCDMIERIEKHIALDPITVQFEITESAASKDIEQTIAILNWLKDRGYRILLDDFGTGYSSLTYLQRLPVDVIKIDRTLIREIVTRIDQQMMIRSIVDLAHHLGMKIVAEGIETREQLELVASSGCDFAQGYYFARPMPEDAF